MRIEGVESTPGELSSQWVEMKARMGALTSRVCCAVAILCATAVVVASTHCSSSTENLCSPSPSDSAALEVRGRPSVRTMSPSSVAVTENGQ